MVRRRFGFSAADRIGCVGRGVMDHVWRGRFYTLPFLYLGTWRRIMFPERGQIIPFTVENFAFVDPLGRETVTWVRTFELGRDRRRRFDAYMIFDEERGAILDYLGTHQHLAVSLDLDVSEKGGLRLRSDEIRFYEGPVGFRVPSFLTGAADVHEWYDDASGEYRIEVSVSNRRWGPLFGYRGRFQADWTESTVVPPHLLPSRYERRT